MAPACWGQQLRVGSFRTLPAARSHGQAEKYRPRLSLHPTWKLDQVKQDRSRAAGSEDQRQHIRTHIIAEAAGANREPTSSGPGTNGRLGAQG